MYLYRPPTELNIHEKKYHLKRDKCFQTKYLGPNNSSSLMGVEGIDPKNSQADFKKIFGRCRFMGNTFQSFRTLTPQSCCLMHSLRNF